MTLEHGPYNIDEYNTMKAALTYYTDKQSIFLSITSKQCFILFAHCITLYVLYSTYMQQKDQGHGSQSRNNKYEFLPQHTIMASDWKEAESGALGNDD